MALLLLVNREARDAFFLFLHDCVVLCLCNYVFSAEIIKKLALLL